jgi:hypothetical protein
MPSTAAVNIKGAEARIRAHSVIVEAKEVGRKAESDVYFGSSVSNTEVIRAR